MSDNVAVSAVVVPQRLVIVVPTDAAHDSRTRRIATSLRERGHEVTVMARQSAAAPEQRQDVRGIRTIRVTTDPVDGLPFPTAVRRGIRGALAWAGGAVARDGGVFTSADRGGRPRFVRVALEAARFVSIGLRIRSQSRASISFDPGADLYIGMAFQGIPVALDLAGRAGSPAIYDIRDLYLDSRNLARLPAMPRRLLRRIERGWIRRSAGTATVNRSCAEVIERRYGVRPTIVMNCPPRRDSAAQTSDLLREAIGLTTGVRIVLYHGGLLVDRGLAQSIQAMTDARLDGVHLAMMGWGEEEARLRDLAGRPAVRGRVHFLPPVEPEAVVDWVACADVAIMVNQPRTFNERASTPNKLFESLAAGTPIVSSDFPERRRILMDDPVGPLGAVCDPTDPTAIAAAIWSILRLDSAAASDLRTRCAKAARDRYTWESQLPYVLDLYRAATGRAW